jgi:choice-of-anchor A domain-containing protein
MLKRSAVVFAMAITGWHGAFAAPIDVLNATAASYNVFLTGNMGSSSSRYTSDSQGAVAAGGNVFVQDFAIANVANHAPNALTVGGSLDYMRGTVGTVTINGNTVVGGNAAFNPTSGGTTINGNLTVGGTINGAPTKVTGTTTTGGGPGVVPINFSATGNDLVSAANSLSALGGQIAGVYNSSGHSLTFTGSNTVQDVFSVTAAQLAGISSGSLVISIPGSATAIINVSGSGTVNFGAPGNFGFNYNGLSNTHVLFNFWQAGSLNMQSVNGSILAPLAAVSYTNGQMNGSLMAASLSGNGQFNDAPFVGVAAAPLPAAYLLLLSGLALVGAFARRPRRSVAIKSHR